MLDLLGILSVSLSLSICAKELSTSEIPPKYVKRDKCCSFRGVSVIEMIWLSPGGECKTCPFCTVSVMSQAGFALEIYFELTSSEILEEAGTGADFKLLSPSAAPTVDKHPQIHPSAKLQNLFFICWNLSSANFPWLTFLMICTQPTSLDVLWYLSLVFVGSKIMVML